MVILLVVGDVLRITALVVMVVVRVILIHPNVIVMVIGFTARPEGSV
jgi:hypothetical protein